MSRRTREQQARDAEAAVEKETAEQPQPSGFFAIPHGLAQATLDYLVTRPYGEVAGLVDGFHRLEQIVVEAPAA